MSCMPKFGRLWAIDFCNQLFLRRTPRDDDRLLPFLLKIAPHSPNILRQQSQTDYEINAGGHFLRNSLVGFFVLTTNIREIGRANQLFCYSRAELSKEAGLAFSHIHILICAAVKSWPDNLASQQPFCSNLHV